jgi:SMI1 / KNR4 family (SUKH-1)
MLDPKQFWARPTGAGRADMGALPDQAQAMLHHLAQSMGAGNLPPTGAQFEQHLRMLQALGGAMPGGAGVSTADIAAWEKRHRVKFPKFLAEVFQLQDGGMVRDTEMYIDLLAAIQPINTDDDIYEDEFQDPRLVFEFGHDGGEGRYLLDYNARGPKKEPAVYLEFRDCGQLDKAAESVDELFSELLKSSDGPEVNWSETKRLRTLAREQIDLTGHFGVPASLDQVLCRDDKSLVLFKHRRGPDGETMTRTVLPEPLSTEVAMGASSVHPIQPGRTDMWQLQLQPRKADGIVQVESTQTGTGRWKNRTSHGVPIYESIWSNDRARLKQLRVELLGKERALRVQKEDDERQELQDKMLALPPEAQHAAFMAMFQRGVAENERLFAETHPGLGEPPPEIAGLMDALQGKLRDAMRRAQEVTAKQPVDPELRKLIEMTLPKPRRPEGGE